MLDKIDLALLESVQRDDGRTSDMLATEVPLSPSAIARRLRHLRREGWIEKTIAILSPQLSKSRTATLVLVQLDHHVPRHGLDRLRERLAKDEAVQWCAEVSGPNDIALLCDHPNLESFSDWADRMLVSDGAVRRYETSFVKRRIRNHPFISLID